MSSTLMTRRKKWQVQRLHLLKVRTERLTDLLKVKEKIRKQIQLYTEQDIVMQMLSGGSEWLATLKESLDNVNSQILEVMDQLDPIDRP